MNKHSKMPLPTPSHANHCQDSPSPGILEGTPSQEYCPTDVESLQLSQHDRTYRNPHTLAASRPFVPSMKDSEHCFLGLPAGHSNVSFRAAFHTRKIATLRTLSPHLASSSVKGHMLRAIYVPAEYHHASLRVTCHTNTAFALGKYSAIAHSAKNSPTAQSA